MLSSTPVHGVRVSFFTAMAASAFAFTMAITAPTIGHAAEVIRSGTFVGQSDHVTTGTVTIEEDGDRIIVTLHEDFSLDGAPAPTLGFSNAGKFDKSTEFAKLESLTGEQRYVVPKGVIASAYDAFTIWCSQFSVPLGTADLG